MTDTAVADEPDWEGEFYKIMATIPQDDWVAGQTALRKDTFLAGNGPTIGWTSDGNIGMLLVMNEPTAKMVMDAYEAWMDHECPAALHTLVHWLLPQSMLLQMFQHEFSDEVAKRTFFKHDHGEGDAAA